MPCVRPTKSEWGLIYNFTQFLPKWGVSMVSEISSMYREERNGISLVWVFSNISDHIIMKIGSFPKNLSFFSQAVWWKMDSDILNVFFFNKTRVCGGWGTKLHFMDSLKSHDTHCWRELRIQNENVMPIKVHLAWTHRVTRSNHSHSLWLVRNEQRNDYKSLCGLLYAFSTIFPITTMNLHYKSLHFSR